MASSETFGKYEVSGKKLALLEEHRQKVRNKAPQCKCGGFRID